VAIALALTPQVGVAQSPTLTVTLRTTSRAVRSTVSWPTANSWDDALGLSAAACTNRSKLWKVRTSWFDQFIREVSWTASRATIRWRTTSWLIRQGGNDEPLCDTG